MSTIPQENSGETDPGQPWSPTKAHALAWQFFEQLNTRDKIRTLFACGILLVFVGVMWFYAVALVIFEAGWRISNYPELAGTPVFVTTGLLLGGIATLLAAGAGFFVTKRNGTPIWYFLVCGVCGVAPGFLFAVGWRAIHQAIAIRREQEANEVDIIVALLVSAAIVGLFLLGLLPQPYGFYLLVVAVVVALVARYRRSRSP